MYTVSQKCTNFETVEEEEGIAQNYKHRFWWYLAKVLKRFQNRVCRLHFLCRFAFISTFCLSNRTPKITPILTLMQMHQHKQGEIF